MNETMDIKIKIREEAESACVELTQLFLNASEYTLTINGAVRKNKAFDTFYFDDIKSPRSVQVYANICRADGAILSVMNTFEYSLTENEYYSFSLSRSSRFICCYEDASYIEMYFVFKANTDTDEGC